MTLEEVFAARQFYMGGGVYTNVRQRYPITNEMAIVFELEAFRVVNTERARIGVPPLVWNDSLAHNARLNAHNIGTLTSERNRESARYGAAQTPASAHVHDHSGNAERAGTTHLWIEDSGWRAANGGNGGVTPAEAIQVWMNSTRGHREAMLNPNHTSVGIGVARVYQGGGFYGIVWYMFLGATDGISEADLFASLGVPLDTTATCPCPATGTASCPCIAQTTPSTPAQPTTPQTPTTPNQTPTPPAANQAPVPTPAPQPAPTPVPPAATQAVTNTVTFTGISRAGSVQFSYTNANGRLLTGAVNNLTSTFNNAAVPFTASRDGEVLVITSNGVTHRLQVGESVTLRG
jgi:uncharacterized protein YkwD